MKKIIYFILSIAVVLFANLCVTTLRAAETNATPRVGIYDSRAVAYAWFWSAKHQKQLNELMQSARDAKAAGDTNRFKELAAVLRKHQDEMHREVFSTAPVAAALAEIKGRLPNIQNIAGVAVLVSKWDDATLNKYPDAEKVDVTDQLIHEFMEPTEQQWKTILSIKKSKPLPLEECDELIRKGKI